MIELTACLVELREDGKSVFMHWCDSDNEALRLATTYQDTHADGMSKVVACRYRQRIDWTPGTIIGTWSKKPVITASYRDWETDRKSTRLNSSHRSLSRMPSSA